MTEVMISVIGVLLAEGTLTVSAAMPSLLATSEAAAPGEPTA